MLALQNLPEEIANFIAQHGLLQAAAFANGQQAGAQRALPQFIRLAIDGFAKVAEQPTGREAVWNAARAAAGAPGGQAPPAPGAGVLQAELGEQHAAAVQAVATREGLSSESANHLDGAAATAALQLMGGLVAEHNWNAWDLGQWLRARPVQRGAMPEGFFDAPVGAPTEATGAATSWFGRNVTILLVAGAVLALGELAYTLRPKSAAPEEAAARPAAGSPAAPAETRTQEQAPLVLKLADGRRQVMGANSTESRLYQFLTDPAMQVDSVNRTKGWITFDRVTFETSKAVLTPESQAQLTNVANILKQFPAAKIRIGGYTDNSGDPERNLKLSEERAKSTMAALVSMGIPAARLTAKGYGMRIPIASNDTEEGRFLNRRVSVRVTHK